MTQDGQLVKVLSRTTLRGYECLECSDGRYRYDRSTGSYDAGRCTGSGDTKGMITATDEEQSFLAGYNCPHNFERYGKRWKSIWSQS